MQASLPQHLYHKLRNLAAQQGQPIEQVLETLIENHQQALQNSEAETPASPSDDPMFYHSLLRSIGEGIVVYDDCGTLIFVNPGAERILGLSSDQLHGRTPLDPNWEAVYPDGSPFPMEKHPAQVTLKTGQDQTNVVMGIKKSDQSVTWVVVNARCLYLEEQAANVVVVSFTEISAQKQIEDNLRESQARLKAILDSVPGTIFIVNRQLQIISMYSATARAEKIDYLPLIGKHIDDILPEKVARQSHEVIERVFTTGEQEGYTSQSLGGHWYDNRIAPVIENGDIVAVTITSINIDEQIEAERALRHSEARLLAILESTPGSIVLVDEDFIIHAIYSAMARNLNMDYDKKIGSPIDSIIHPNTIPTMHRNIKAVFATGEHRQFEAMSLTSRWYTVHLAPVWEDNTITRVTIISMEITDRKQMEQALKDSEAYLRVLLNSIPGMVISVDRNGDTLSINENVKGSGDGDDWKNIFRIVRSDHEARIIREQIEAAFEKGESRQSEILGPDDRWYDVRSAPVRRKGEVVAVTFISMDIQDRMLVEQRNRALIIEQERVRVLTHFIQGTSHEFRTPLSVINSSLYMIERVTDPEKRQRHATMIQTQVHNLSRLLDDLVLMARLDSDTSFKPYPYNMDMLVRQAITPLEKSTINYQLDDDLPYLFGDAEEIKKALDHVLSNAVRSGTTGIDITLRLIDEHIVTTITDHGEGMTPEQVERAFERFYRGNPAHTLRGFGLGLPIVQRIVQRHSGTIDLSSTFGVGTKVTISLPIRKDLGTKS